MLFHPTSSSSRYRQSGNVRVIVPPVAEPLDLDEVKNHLRVDLDWAVDDALIHALISAAREGVEHLTGRSLMTQQLEMALDCFPQQIELTGSPVQTVESVKYLDPDGNMQTCAQESYVLDDFSSPPRLYPAYGKNWPAIRLQPNAVVIAYTVGYESAAEVPVQIKQWMLLRIGAMYANREAVNVGATVTDMPYVDRLLDRFRVWEA